MAQLMHIVFYHNHVSFFFVLSFNWHQASRAYQEHLKKNAARVLPESTGEVYSIKTFKRDLDS